MNTEKVQRTLLATIIASESIHIFCCVLPTVFSILSLLAGLGMIATMPTFIDNAHGLIHAYEIPVIVFSGIILVIGWGLYAYSRKLNCREEASCCHEPCEPKKDRTKAFMIAATVLFVANVTVYMVFHRGMDEHFHVGETHAIVSGHEDAHNHHSH